MQTVNLKAKPAPETIKTGGAKGSWGKPGPKAAAAAAAGSAVFSAVASASTAVKEAVLPASADGKPERTMLSNGSSGFEIPIKSGMFSADRI